MPRYALSLLLLVPLHLKAQTLIDTSTIDAAQKVIGLTFTSSEKDSMLEDLRGNSENYRKMRKLPIPNDLSYPFAFQPHPAGYTVPKDQQETKWELPLETELPEDYNQWAFMTVAQWAALIKTKKISSEQLTRYYLGRLKKWGDTLECVITLTEELALKQAREADAELKKGIYRGPLHGIPYGLKDLFSVKGFKTTWGSVPYKDQVIDQDAFVYTQLRKAGAVLCAKLTLGELAYADLWFGGRTRNPWNIATGSSGSSAGSASATAAGLLPFTIGTETWGSIVSPSHTCGVTGLRPTFGSVSRSGAMVLSWSLDKIGPICRTAEDAAIVFFYLKGSDGKDPGATERAFNYTGIADWKKLRIAYASNYFNKLPRGNPQTAFIETLKKAGAQVREVEFPDSAVYSFNIMDPIIGAETAAAFDELTRNDRDDLIRRQDKNFWPNGFRASRFIPAVEYINANRHRYTLIEKMNNFLKAYDVVIVPSFSGNQLAITNLTGHPVVCLPVGFTAGKLPTSITLIGNLYDEATLLAVAKAFQDRTDFHQLHPALFTK